MRTAIIIKIRAIKAGINKYMILVLFKSPALLNPGEY
jgi:hypothetical protein